MLVLKVTGGVKAGEDFSFEGGDEGRVHVVVVLQQHICPIFLHHIVAELLDHISEVEDEAVIFIHHTKPVVVVVVDCYRCFFFFFYECRFSSFTDW